MDRTKTAHAARIASLLASATEMVNALGLEDRLIAISHECDYPERVLDRPRLSRPRFDPDGLSSGEIDSAVRHAMLEHGSVYEVDADALERLRPDLILTQAVCEVCAVPTPGVRDVVDARGIDARVLSLDAHTLAEILDSMRAIGRAAGAEDAAARAVARLEARLDAVRRAVHGAARPTVLAIEWLDPPFAPGHWVPEMIEAAGGRNLVGRAGAHSEQTTWDALTGLDPDVLIVMPCGYGLDASRRDADRFADQLLAVAPRAIADGRAFVVDGSSYFNRSGPRAFDGVEILAGLLHPGVCPAPAPVAAAQWAPRGSSVASSGAARHITVRRTARIAMLGGPATAVREAWLACHGYGQLAARFIRRFEPIRSPHRLIVAPEALNRFYLDGGSGPHGPESRVGATWMTREDRLAEIDDYVAYLDAVLDDLDPPAGVALVAFGFSQGVATICRWAARTGRPIRDIVLWSGFLPPEIEPRADLFGSARVTFAYGARDAFAAPDRIRRESERFGRAGLVHRVFGYDGGHDVDADALVRLADDFG